MAERLVKIEPACGGRDGTLVTTFHAFALRTLSEEIDGRRNFNRIGFRGDAVLMNTRQRFEVLSHVSTTLVRKTLRMSIIELSAALELLSSFPERASEKWGDVDAKLLMKIESDFSAVRRERGLWDFSDLISGCLELFKNFPHIASVYTNRFDAILVDEFQDTNPMQIDLLEVLLGAGERGTDFDRSHINKNNATLYAVGDDDQAIYGFRGADIRPIMNFTSRFENARIIKLEINYRSIESILNCANKLWVNKPPEYRKTLVCGLSSPPTGCRKPQIMRFGTQTQALEWILGKARFICRRENIPITEMALLFRLNDTLTAVADHFKELGISDDEIPQFLTVHASKGLEYPVVFLCDLEDGIFPHYRMRKERAIESWTGLLMALVKHKKPYIDPACDFDEELRLFYVGVTRARRFLFFVTAFQKPFYGRMMNFIPSRFLKLVK